MTEFIHNFLQDEAGAAAAEYALILAIVGSGLAGAAFYLAQSIGNSLNSTGDEIVGCTTGNNHNC